MDENPVRIRSKLYLSHIRTKPCMVCGNHAEAHHLTYAQPRAMGLKTGDQYTVPLCHKHHMELHESPMPERTWWALNGIDPVKWAEKSWHDWWEETNGREGRKS